MRRNITTKRSLVTAPIKWCYKTCIKQQFFIVVTIYNAARLMQFLNNITTEYSHFNICHKSGQSSWKAVFSQQTNALVLIHIYRYIWRWGQNFLWWQINTDSLTWVTVTMAHSVIILEHSRQRRPGSMKPAHSLYDLLKLGGLLVWCFAKCFNDFVAKSVCYRAVKTVATPGQ